MPTLAENLASWRVLAEAATPSEWRIEIDDNDQSNIYSEDGEWIALLPHQCVASIEQQRNRDAAFIAAARDAVPALIAEIDRLKAIEAERAVLASQCHANRHVFIGGYSRDCICRRTTERR